MPRRPKQFKLREDYRPLLIKVKKLFPTVLAHIKTKRIALAGMEGRTSSFLARIHPNRRPWSLLSPQYDYLILFWSTRFDDRKRSFKLFVMFHELRHIPQDGQTKGHPDFRRTIKHDIEDFHELRHAYGLRLDKTKEILKGEEYLLNAGKLDARPKKKKHAEGKIV